VKNSHVAGAVAAAPVYARLEEHRYDTGVFARAMVTPLRTSQRRTPDCSEGKLRSYHVGKAHRVSEDAIRDCVAALEHESAIAQSQSACGYESAVALSNQ
jgi:hypothetical protein